MKFLITILCIATMASCKVTKLDHATGDKNPRSNTKHFQRIYAKQGGFWAGGKFIIFPGVHFKKIEKNK